MSRRENRAEVDRTFAIMDLIRNLIRQAHRMEVTPPVDDDFPRVKHAFDQAVLDYAAALRERTP
jgi:hypothetical protein